MFGSGESFLFILVVAVFACMIEYFVIKWAVKDGIKESGILAAIDHTHDADTGVENHDSVKTESDETSHTA